MDEAIEFVNLRVIALGKSPRVKLKRSSTSETRDPHKHDRSVFYEGIGFQDVPIYERKWIPDKFVVNGPAIIEEEFSSTVLIPGSSATIDQFKNIIIKIK